MSAATLVIGIGNPLLSDDRVGLVVARTLGEVLRLRPEIAVGELYHGGLALMEALAGYRRAVVVDAMSGSGLAAGSWCWLDPRLLTTARHCASGHDVDFATAVRMARLLGMALPEEIAVIGVEAQELATFGESLTPAVAEAVPQVVGAICAHLGLAREAA